MKNMKRKIKKIKMPKANYDIDEIQKIHKAYLRDIVYDVFQIPSQYRSLIQENMEEQNRMKVGEIIEELKKYPEDWDVYIYSKANASGYFDILEVDTDEDIGGDGILSGFGKGPVVTIEAGVEGI